MKVKRVVSRACWKFKGKVKSVAPGVFAKYREIPRASEGPTRKCWKAQEKVQSAEARACWKFQERAKSVAASRAFWLF